MSERFALHRSEHCLSRLALDRLLADERTGREDALAHLQSCEGCRDRFEALRAERAARLTDATVRAGAERIMAAAHTRQPSWRKWLRPVFWLPAAATIATILLLVQFRSHTPDSGGDSIRLKGAPTFQVLVVEKQGARPLSESDRLRPGATLAFQALTDRDSFVALVGLSETGPASIVDSDGSAPWHVPAGSVQQLPVSAQLDRAAGDERIFAVFCDRPPVRSELLGRVEMAYPPVRAERRDLNPRRDPSVSGCITRSVLVRRVR